MVEGTGKRVRAGLKSSTDRHILTLSPELSEQVDNALEIARLRTILKPVEATLGNPVAFPIIAGGIGILVGFLALKLLFPDPLAQARSVVEKAADTIAETLEKLTPEAPFPGLELGTGAFVETTRDLLMRLWDGISKLPPIL